jgi:GntR family transcriptional regulator
MEQSSGHIVAEFAQATVAGIPKHVRLRNALLSAIRKGYLRPGDQLPPEQELSKAVGLSLGTVQRALGSLAIERALTREQGRGTFVSRPGLSPDDLWQFRFVERYGSDPLPVSVEVLDRALVRERRPWLDVLGHDNRGYCELTRLVIVNKSFRCLSRVYVCAGRFPKIMKTPLSKMTGNFKRFLAEEFDTPTHAIEQFMMPSVLDTETCSRLEIAQGSAGMVVNTIGRSVGREAITFQSLSVPNGPYYLEVVATAPAPGIAR